MAMALHGMYRIKVMAHANVWFRQGVSATENLGVKIVEAICTQNFTFTVQKKYENI